MNDEETVIRLDAVTKTYQSADLAVPVLRGIDLTIEARERLVIMGRSGSGKSTLMNILGCLDVPSSGRYQLFGQEVSEMNDDTISLLRGQTIGFVFQSFHLLPGLTVLENVKLPLEYVPAPGGEERALELLERVGLSHRLDHRPHKLSGGERQRVAIARALVNRPAILLADEPTGNLDSRAQHAILDLFGELHEETEVTMVMVTHDPAIGAWAPRLIQVSDGRVVEDGRPS